MAWASKEDRDDWYQKNKDRLNHSRRQEYKTDPVYRQKKIDETMMRRRRNQDYVREYKLSIGCQKCGFKDHHVALELHHRDHKSKEIHIGCNTSSLKKIKSEIAKCDVLCANCHRIMHYETGWITESIKNESFH